MNMQEIVARLDKQAAAIKDLRARVKELEGGDMRIPVRHGTVEHTGTWGVFVPNPRCVVCGADKGGRSELTCRPCGAARLAGIRGDAPRITYIRCGNCGKAKGPNTTVLCGKCSLAYREWKGRGKKR